MALVGSWLSGLRGKLLFLAVFPVLVIGIISFSSFRGIKSQRESLRLVSTERMSLTQYLGELRSDINALGRFTWLAIGNQENLEARQKALSNARETSQHFSEVLKKLEGIPMRQANQERFKSIVQTRDELVRVSGETWALIEQNKTDEARKHYLANFATRVAPILKALNEMHSTSMERNNEIVAQANEDAARTELLVTILSITTGLLMFVVAFLIASRLVKSLTQVAESLTSAGSQVGSASEQLSASSQQLSTGATEAAASLEQTVSSLEELSSMVKVNSENAKQAAALSSESQKCAVEGEHEIRNLIEAMQDISQSSRKIEEIINVIDDIAFQTNLLALNAAVEAARAGEQGKGFAVVADAVRNLAQRSASAAKDISSLIKESVGKTERGSKVASQSGEVLKNIVTSVKKVADLNEEIASASQEQSNGLGQISSAMNQLDQATQTNAAAAEESAASAEELNSQAIVLSRVVGELGAVIHGANTTATGAPASHAPVPRTQAYAPGHAPKAPHAKNVVPFKKKKPETAEAAIPFDEEPASKLGNVQGF